MTEVEKIISGTKSQLGKILSEYPKKLSKVDKEISDIYHYIEVSNLDAYRGWKAYKLLKDKLIERRKIKDEFDAAKRLRKSIQNKTKEINKQHATKKYTTKKAVIKL